MSLKKQLHIHISSKRMMNPSLLFMFFILPSVLISGTTGKIVGTATDASTGEPLIGCNVVILGTTMGAASNTEGEYFIINVPPGQHVINAHMVGYNSVIVDNVRIVMDLTTRVDFQFEPKAIPMDEEVRIVAERPMVQKDITSKISIIGAREINNMPIDDFQGILSTKAGFTTDSEGNMHVRGGRTGEITYMIDGMYVEDPLYGGFGRDPSYGGFGNIINRDAIEEMIVLCGAFNAEYGDAMSSVVSIVTKEGGDSYHGKLEYSSPMLNDSPYRRGSAFPGVEDSYEYVEQSIVDDMEWDPSELDFPVLGVINSSLSGPFPFLPKLSFFLSGRYENEDSYLPHGYSLERDGMAKLTYRFNPSMKLSITDHNTKHEHQRYNHAWKYRSDHQKYNVENTNRLGFTFTHSISGKLFYTLLFSQYNYQLQTIVQDKLPDEYEMGQTGETVYFYVNGDDDDFVDDRTATYSGKADVTYQANSHHQLRSGIEFQLHEIDVYEEIEPWPSGAQFEEKYEREPFEFAGYVQDKIEYDYLILNIGLRYDYADPKATMWQNIFRFGYWDEENNWTPANEEEVAAKTQLSPRIGLAHPITDRASLHFSYGHFFQNPNYHALYYNSHKDLSTSMPLVGNPKVKAQKTVTYETGIKYQIAENWAFDVTAWYKDITDLLSTLHISYLSQDYVVFYNSDYASVKGIDLTLRKRHSDFLSGSIDYTYMVAKGSNSQPLGGYIDAFSEEEIPHQEYPLDFDQRHDVAINLDLSIPENDGPELAGFKPLSDFNVNLLFQAGSGLPYTPYVDPTLRIDVNSERKPWTSTVDIRMIKRLHLGGIEPGVFVQVSNLFDRENVIYVYPRTGKPFDTGLSGLVGSSPDANHNPAHVGPPRMIKAGIQLVW